MFDIFKKGSKDIEDLQKMYDEALDEIIQLRSTLLHLQEVEIRNQSLVEEVKHLKSLIERSRNGCD
jgi:archaellum component FlaC